MSFFKSLKVTILVISLLTQAHIAWGLTIGTFNMEYFDISGEKAYRQDDLKYLAKKILSSKVDILALQEIEGNKTMEFFVKKFLPDWNYEGNDTKSKQDLYFLWKNKKIKIEGKPCPQFLNTRLNWKGNILPLFSRPPLKAEFKDIETGFSFSLINVHLRGLATSGKRDKLSAITYNNAIRQAQAVELFRLAKNTSGPVFVIGDYNSVSLPQLNLPILTLKNGFSFDKLQCTIDHIAYDKISPDSSWILYEIESSVPRRSSSKYEHPDHDIVILSLIPHSKSEIHD